MKLVVFPVIAAAVAIVPACSSSGQPASVSAAASSGAAQPAVVSVTSTDAECKLSTTQAKAGTLEFEVKNDGSRETEFYLLGADGQEVISEVENIGPGVTRTMVVTATPGKYFSSCKPGMAGDGIKAEFVVVE